MAPSTPSIHGSDNNQQNCVFLKPSYINMSMLHLCKKKYRERLNVRMQLETTGPASPAFCGVLLHRNPRRKFVSFINSA